MDLEFDLVSDVPFPPNVEEMLNDVIVFIEEHQEVLREEDTVAKFIDMCDEKNYPMPVAQQMAYQILLAISDEETVEKMLNFDSDPANTTH